MIPDRLPEALREVIARFPPGALQFEVGVQSFNSAVCQRIRRRQDFRKLEDNFHFLRTQTGVHIHSDLIVGLPGESLESFAAGFDRLVRLGPQEIQVGILKRLRGTPIGRHDAEWQMVYNPHPPYAILQNRLIDFATMQKLRRFARYWDLVGNSGNFMETLPLIWSKEAKEPGLSARIQTAPGGPNTVADGEAAPHFGKGQTPVLPSPFWAFLSWSQWLYVQIGRTDSIALVRLTELLFRYLTTELGLDPRATAETLWRDYQRGGRRDTPEFLRPYLAGQRRESKPSRPPRSLKRQGRHWSRRET
jgi:hypothetical protein